MSTKSFRGKNITSFSGFRGVDFSSSPLDVDARRASEMENFISDFGILKKRNGWKQEREFVTNDGERLPVCGVFAYKNGEATHVLVHAGDRFFRITDNGYERIGAELDGITATRSEAYLQKGRLYIVGCGDYLAYGLCKNKAGEDVYDLWRVYDSESAYIPTTTINIGANEGDVSAILDGINLLTPWRKNRLNGIPFYRESNGESESVYYKGTYYLDAPIEFGTTVTVGVLSDGVENSGTIEQDKEFHGEKKEEKVGYRHIGDDGSIFMVFYQGVPLPGDSFAITVENTSYTCSGGNIVRSGTTYGTYEVENNILTIRPSNLNSYFYPSEFDSPLYCSNLKVGAYTVDTRIEVSIQLYTGDKLKVSADIRYPDGRIRFDAKGTNLMDSVVAYGDGEDVFEVTFRAVIPEEEGVIPYPERIKNCSFGTLFGVDGASDRLFLSGNPSLMNTEFYSEADDFSYFPDINTIQLGSDNVPIVGYLRLSDGTLSVFKERRGVGDATIYYRTSYYKQYNADDGGLERIDAVFPTVAGNSGEAMISRFSAKDFGGDKLFLSENGVFGVVVSENITVNERYTRERSRAVNARLTREAALSEAVATVYKDKYYLAVNGNVYVADSRYRNTRADNVDGAWGYEWYFLAGVPARVFAEIDGRLWFGTEDGRLCRFDDGYSDRTYSLYGSGELTLSGEADTDGFFLGVVTNAQRDPTFLVGDTFTTNDALFALVLSDLTSAEDGRIRSEDTLRLAALAEGERVYLCYNGIPVTDDAYEVRDIDLLEGCFSLYKDGELAEVACDGLALIRSLKGLSLDVLEVSEGRATLGLYGEALCLIGSVASGKLWHKENVCARWVSCVTNLGVSIVGKGLHRLSITCEPTVRGRVTFGYNTRMGNLRQVSEGGGKIFSLTDFDFRNFSFDTGFAASYSVRVFERNVNYVALAVESIEDAACAFNRLELEWSYGRHLTGVR